MAFNANAYKTDFQRKNYDRLIVLVPKGRGEEVKALAKSRGMTISQVVVDALENHCKLDLSKKPTDNN